MITIQTKDGKEFAAKPAVSLKKEYQGLVRDGIGLTLLDTTYQKAKNAFGEGQDFTIIIANEESSEAYEQVGYCLCAKLTDTMDGNIYIELFKRTDEERTADEMTGAYTILAGTANPGRAGALREAVEALVSGMNDEGALAVPELFPVWDASGGYTVGERVSYEETLYKCLTEHTAQESWNPADSPSLWVRVADPAQEWPEIPNPIPAENPYQIGDKGQKDGKRYISLMENNVWQPEDYPAAWEEVAW